MDTNKIDQTHQIEFGRQVKRLTIKILIIHTVSFLIFTAAGVFYTESLKKALSQQMASTMKRSILLGDHRQAILEAEHLATTQFISIAYTQSDHLVFSLPGIAKAPPMEAPRGIKRLVYSQYSYPILFDQNNTGRLGDIIFTYNRLESFPFVFVIWSILAVFLFIFMRRARNDLLLIQKNSIESKKALVLAGVASRVSHDLRSPVTALDSFLESTAALPENDRVLARKAVQGIKDIANTLLTESKDIALTEFKLEEKTERVLISALIENVISEKRLLLRQRKGIEIVFEVADGCFTIFSELNALELTRALSNLIDNSIAALFGMGRITIGLSAGGDTGKKQFLITIKDNGVGIPPEVIAQLGKSKITDGKQEGQGLGFYTASKTIKAFGGQIEVASVYCVPDVSGTTIRITLPKSEPPAWFSSTINLSQGDLVIVLDDSPSVHDVWKKKFSISGVNHLVKLHCFSRSADFETFIGTLDASDLRRTVFLMDYELIGEQKNGLDVIESSGIAERSFLVSSRWSERDVLFRAERMGVRVIPKEVLNYIKIDIIDASAGLTVLIDDSELVGDNWSLIAKKKNKDFLYFRSVDEFAAKAPKIPRSAAIYIDSDLGDGRRGEVAAKGIYEQGFLNISLTTGHLRSDFKECAWIRNVIGKRPPF